MRCTGLQSFAILHHRFDRKSLIGAWESFASGLLSAYDRHGHVVLGKVGVHVEHLVGLFHCFLGCGVDGVSFLPEKLGGAKEESGSHFPANHVGPLIDQDRQIPIGLHPLGIGRADDRLACGTDNERFFEWACRPQATFAVWFEPMVGDYRALFRKAFDVLSFLFQEAHWNKQGEVRILVTGLFKHPIESFLHVFPERIAPRLDDHATANGAVFG